MYYNADLISVKQIYANDSKLFSSVFLLKLDNYIGSTFYVKSISKHIVYRL